jgi:hypothetical protein
MSVVCSTGWQIGNGSLKDTQAKLPLTRGNDSACGSMENSAGLRAATRRELRAGNTGTLTEVGRGDASIAGRAIYVQGIGGQ